MTIIRFFIDDGGGLTNPPDYLTPEKRLLIAVVQRALMDYLIPERGKSYLQWDAGAWLYSNKRDPWSLFWCIEHLISSESQSVEDLVKRIRSAKQAPFKHVIVRVDR